MWLRERWFAAIWLGVAIGGGGPSVGLWIAGAPVPAGDVAFDPGPAGPGGPSNGAAGAEGLLAEIFEADR